MQNKFAVITGGASGIGFAMAKYLQKAGAKIVLISRNEQNLKEAKENLLKRGECDYFSYDLSKEKEILFCAENVLKSFGVPDIVVNAAGINLRQKANDITFESWDRTIDINLKAVFFFTREFMPGMVKRKSGKVINIASLQSFRAFDNSIPYGASKGGVAQLTRALAQEYSKNNIQINAIAPGFFSTPLTSTLFADKQKLTLLANQTAIGRNGKLEDFEGISIFLASKASDYITGETIFLDGGFSAK